MNHLVDITPEGMKTKEGQVRVKVTMQAKDEAEQEAIRNLRELMKATSYAPGRQELIDILTVWYGDEDIAQAIINDCVSSLNAIDEANEEFLQAVAGR